LQITRASPLIQLEEKLKNQQKLLRKVPPKYKKKQKQGAADKVPPPWGGSPAA
jgi:hypothetical protein